MKARVAGLLAVVSAMSWCTCASALPGEWALGGELGAGRSTRTMWSPSFGLRGAYGLAEALDMQLELSGQWLRLESNSAVMDHGLLRVIPALSYKVDVVRWIPFVRAGAGPALNVPLEGNDVSRLSLALSGAVGVDYLVDRSLSWGLTYQADWLFGNKDSAVNLAPIHRLLLTVLWRSGW